MTLSIRTFCVLHYHAENPLGCLFYDTHSLITSNHFILAEIDKGSIIVNKRRWLDWR